MNVRTMQAELPAWHVDGFEHAVTHAMKALGKLAGMIDDADHARANRPRPTLGELEAILASEPARTVSVLPNGQVTVGGDFAAQPQDVAKFAADLVVCALKMAQTCPSGAFDLEAAVVARVREKNPPGTFPSADAVAPSSSLAEAYRGNL